MTTSDFLYNKAVNEVWANPHIDRQFLFQMNRISKPHGVINQLFLPFIQINAPIPDNRFVYFELSSLSPRSLGLDGPNSSISSWRRIPDIMEDSNFIIYLLTDGVLADLHNCWICRLNTGNIIVAVDCTENNNWCKSTEPFYIRFYSFVDQSFATTYSQLDYQRVEKGVDTELAWNTLVNTVYAIDGMKGHIFINGERPNAPIYWANAVVGDVLQVILDDSISYVDDSADDISGSNVLVEDITQLNSYTSSGDATHKYIVHLDKGRSGNYYHDDMEIYLQMEYPGSVFRTKYIPRVYKSTCRSLTGVDLSINVGQLDDVIEKTNLQQGVNVIKSHLVIILRPTHRTRLDVLDGNRIRDLQRLTPSQRSMVMAGVNATVDVWKADVLETCAYNMFRSLEYKDLNFESFLGLFSMYGAVSAIERMQNTPDGWVLPPILQNGGGRLVSFDVDGYRRTTNVFEPTYNLAGTPTGTVDAFTGQELLLPDYGWDSTIDILAAAGNANDTEIEADFDVFVYYMVGTTPTKAILNQDYTLTTINDVTVVEWDASIVGYDRYVRTAQRRIQWTSNPTDEEIIDGLPIYGGQETRLAHDIGFGRCYVWWNGRYMVEGIDYVIEKPSADVNLFDTRIFLLVKPEWIENVTRTVEVLLVGLPDDNFKFNPKGSTGWVRHGYVSNDNEYNLYADRNKWIFADGKNVVGYNGYAEGILDDDDTNVGPLIDSDGRPFAIVPLPQFIRTFDIEEVTETTFEQEAIIDEQLEAYLSYFIPQEPSEDPIVVNVVYDLYSPFINHLSQLIVDGDLIINLMNMSLESIQLIVQPYLYLLDKDPTQLNHPDGWVEYHPRFSMTPVGISATGLNFLQRCNDLFCNGKVGGWNLYFTIV